MPRVIKNLFGEMTLDFSNVIPKPEQKLETEVNANQQAFEFGITARPVLF